MVLKKIYHIFCTGLSFLRSTKLAIILLVLVFLSSILGTILPPLFSREIIFSSWWFNFLLFLLMVNILFCTLKRIKRLFVKTVSSVESVMSVSPLTDERTKQTKRLNGFNFLSLLGSIIFHFSFVLLFVGVIYNTLFFFEGGIRLTEGESLSCGDEANYDWIRKGRFFKNAKLKDLGELCFLKLIPAYYIKGSYKGQANKIIFRPSINPDNLPFQRTVQSGAGQDLSEENKDTEALVYANHPFKHKGYEFYRDTDGFSLLFVFRDRWGRILDGAYTPLNTVRRPDGSSNYVGGFPFPPRSPFLRLWIVFFPEIKSNTLRNEQGKVFLEVKQPVSHGSEEEKEVFKGKIGIKEMAAVGPFFISVDEIRYWSRMQVNYRPGLPLIFGSFWFALGGLSLATIAKMRK